MRTLRKLLLVTALPVDSQTVRSKTTLWNVNEGQEVVIKSVTTVLFVDQPTTWHINTFDYNWNPWSVLYYLGFVAGQIPAGAVGDLDDDNGDIL